MGAEIKKQIEGSVDKMPVPVMDGELRIQAAQSLRGGEGGQAIFCCLPQENDRAGEGAFVSIDVRGSCIGRTPRVPAVGAAAENRAIAV